MDAVRWRTGLPAAMGARLTNRAVEWRLARTLEPVWAALGGITHLELPQCVDVTDKLLLRLPISLRVLSVRSCNWLTAAASFAHLTALASLDCGGTVVVSEQTDGLPPSLQELDICNARGLRLVSLAHLRQLRVLRADGMNIATVASLPPSLDELYAVSCWDPTLSVSFAHLTALRKLNIAYSDFGDGSMASMPSSLEFLNVIGCNDLSPAAVLPPLPALQLLDVRGTAIGDALVASLPSSLIELRLAGCRCVTAGASLDHVRALRLLHCIGTELAPATLAGCRARACVVPAASVLRGRVAPIVSLARLADGRLASVTFDGEVRLWNVAGGGDATIVLAAGSATRALTVLRDGCRLAVGTALQYDERGCVEVWDVDGIPPVRRATINCRSGVMALAVLPDGRLAAGCADGKVRIVDVDVGAVATTLSGHTGGVTALAVLSDGLLASGSTDNSVRVWDVGARACVATLTGHTNTVLSLAVLTDGRLASGAYFDDAVRLWDVGARACVGVLSNPTSKVKKLAALPDGRLATGSMDGTIQLWDTRPAAAAGASRTASAMSVVVSILPGSGSLLLLPDGRLACSSGGGTLCLLELPPPAAYE